MSELIEFDYGSQVLRYNGEVIDRETVAEISFGVGVIEIRSAGGTNPIKEQL